VLVTHSGLQHSHQLAMALEQAGHLEEFWSGVPVYDPREWQDSLAGILAGRLRRVEVPSRKRRHDVFFPLTQRLLSKTLPVRLAKIWTHRLDHLYDAWVSRRINNANPDVVVCYENSALRTFRAAKAVGAICILDAASVHYSAQREWFGEVGRRDPDWIERQKQQEVELADAILTCSEFAADTYRAAGVPDSKIYPVLLGADLPSGVSRSRRAEATCRFVFVGSLTRLKAVDILLDVFEEFQQARVPATLTLIGGVSDGALAARAKRIPNTTCRPFLPQPGLFEEVAKYDVLVLPSRFESFGMVVPEAMAAGVPALVSDHVGAKCIIEKHPGSGWIVPCDTVAIREKMLELVNNRDRVASAAVIARRAAQDYSWAKYRERIVATIQSIYATHRGGA
jgi:glycosyltransferase involved in cell wall biosynthesis